MALLPRGLLQDATGRSGVAMAVAPGGKVSVRIDSRITTL